MKYLFILLPLFLQSSCGTPSVVKTGREGTEMPSFNLQLMDSIHEMNTNKIPKGKPVVFILFSPSCPYCRALTEEIVKDIQSLDGIHFYVISPSPLDEIRNYYGHYHLEKYPNITVGRDYSLFFQKYFSVDGVPYIAIYNSANKLKKVLIGKVEISLIKKIALD